MEPYYNGAIAPIGALVCSFALAVVAITESHTAARLEGGSVGPSAFAATPVTSLSESLRSGPLQLASLTVGDTLVGKRIPTVDDYLCEVYNRVRVKKDGNGDFTWKDSVAAKRLRMDVCHYAIGGLNPKFKESLVAFGKAADDKGIRWSMLSAFRDDYRQRIASGIKASGGNSQHGGSRATHGYGDGRAIDIAAAGPVKPVLALLDAIGHKFGLIRPYKGFDPMHVQMVFSKTKWAKRNKTRYAKYRKHRRQYPVDPAAIAQNSAGTIY